MELRISILGRITHLTLSGALGFGLILAIAAGGTGRTLAQECEPWPYTPPPAPLGADVWDEVWDEEGGDEGRIAVVVHYRLYDENPELQDSIRTHSDDLKAEGHDLVLVRFNGDAEYLRGQIKQELYDEPPSLTGAVLVGGELPYIIYKAGDDGWPADVFFMDMDGTWHQVEQGVYDSWDDPQDVEIWVSRIKADNLPGIKTPGEAGAAPMEEHEVITRYFERNHAHRWSAFAADNAALVIRADDASATCPSSVEALENAFATVDEMCEDTSTGQYLKILGREAPYTTDYHYIVEISHGSTWLHEFTEDGTFEIALHNAAGDGPSSVATGHLNWDEVPDLVVANENSDNVSVLLGVGDGTFVEAAPYDVDDGPRSVAIGFLDDDGDADLAVANSMSNNVSVLLGNGDGTFGAAQDYNAGERPYSVAIGDLNGDEMPDLAVANSGSDNVSVLLGLGGGAFAPAVPYDTGSAPYSVAVGDLNGDEMPDLAVANYDSDTVSVLLGDGDGAFEPAVHYDVGDGPWSVAIGELYGDAVPDLAVANYNSDTVSVLEGQVGGTFATAVNYDAGDGPQCVVIGHLEGDEVPAVPDLAVANYDGDNVSVLFGVGPAVLGKHYVRKDPQVIGITVNSCHTCNFAFDNYLGGYVAFNPYHPHEVSDLDTSTLVVFGFTWSGGPHEEDVLWNEVATGRCFGEGFQAACNAFPYTGIVLLGDGSVKVDPQCWDGDGFYDDWSDHLNWEQDERPEWDDHVRIGTVDEPPTPATVQVDVGTYEDPEDIWSIALRDGAGLVFPDLPPLGTGLRLAASLFADPVEPDGSTITMHPHSRLQLVGPDGTLRDASVIMMDALAGMPTTLEVQGLIDDCEVEVGQNCDINISTGVVDDCDVNVGPNGLVTAGDIYGSVFDGMVGNVDAEGIISNCEFGVATNGHVTAGGIWSCGFNVVEGIVNVDAMIYNSEFVLGQDSHVTADVINHCRFEVGTNGLVEATGGIPGWPTTGKEQDWTSDPGTVGAGPSTLWGSWEFTGGSATFDRMSANPEYGITMELKDGAQVQIEEILYECPTFPGTYGLDHPQHELVYGPGANQFGGGQGIAPLWEVMHIGDYTVIRALDEQEGNVLNLDLSCELYIESDFRNDFVYQGWNTTGVDITARPIWSETPYYWYQSIELISPNLAAWFRSQSVVFLDVPCEGAFQDLLIPTPEPDDWPGPPYDPEPGATWAAHWWDNSAIDEGARASWEPRGRDDSGPPEAGVFRNVTVEAGRALTFAEVNGVIYYTGERIIDGTILYWAEGATEPMEVTGETDPKIDDLIVPAVGTIYGDWNGDCAITNVELADLQNAIAGGDETYNPLMECNCDGYLADPEIAAFLANMTKQPPCGRGGGDGGGAGGESGTESYEGYDDVPGLAAWLMEVLSEEQLEAFVADLAAAATEFADSPVGQDLAELLSCLE